MVYIITSSCFHICKATVVSRQPIERTADNSQIKNKREEEQPHPPYGVMALTVEEVAAESRGKMPPQAMMRLSTTWEMRWMLLWTNTTFSLLFTKSKIVFVE